MKTKFQFILSILIFACLNIGFGQNLEKIFLGSKIVGEIEYECFLQSDEENYFNPFHDMNHGNRAKLDGKGKTNVKAFIRISKVFFNKYVKGAEISINQVDGGKAFASNGIFLPISLKAGEKIDIKLPIKDGINKETKGRLGIAYIVQNRNGDRIQKDKALINVKYKLIPGNSTDRGGGLKNVITGVTDKVIEFADGLKPETRSFKDAVQSAEKAASESGLDRKQEVIKIYENHIKAYPGTQSAAQAEIEIRTFCDNEYNRVYAAKDRWWLKQFVEGAYVNCEKYGKYKDRATHAIKEIKKESEDPEEKQKTDEDYWKDAKRINTEYSYRKYLRKKTNKKYVTEANIRINAIQSKDEQATAQLANDLKAATNDLQQQLDAYEKYLDLRPAGHYTRKKDTAKKESKRIAALIGAFFVAVDREGEGKIKVEIHNKEVQNANELDISFYRKGQLITEKEYVRSKIIKQNGKFIFTVSEVEGGNNKIAVIAKNRSKERNFSMPARDEKIVVEEATRKEGESTITSQALRIRGGEGPFTLKYKKENGGWSEAISVGNKRYVEDLTEFNEAFKEGGTFELNVTNPYNVSLGTTKVSMSGSTIPWLLLSFLAAFFSILGLLFLNRDKLREIAVVRLVTGMKSKEQIGLEQKIQEAATQVQEEGVAVNGEHTDKKQIKIKSNTSTENSLESDRKKVIISKKPSLPALANTTRAKGALDIEGIANDDSYYTYDLTANWKNTAVTKIYLKHSCAAALNKAIQDESDRRDMSGDKHPEIGGFFLGKVADLGTSGYHVSMEEYVAVPTKKQDVYEVEFDESSWDKLDDEMQKLPDLLLVSWFHTHPGHTLFLSGPDLKIQKGFFTKPYQFATEMDTLSLNLDIAFFTWKNNGDINNDEDRISSDWLSWDKITKWRRQMKNRIS